MVLTTKVRQKDIVVKVQVDGEHHTFTIRSTNDIQTAADILFGNSFRLSINKKRFVDVVTEEILDLHG